VPAGLGEDQRLGTHRDIQDAERGPQVAVLRLVGQRDFTVLEALFKLGDGVSQIR